MQKKHILKKKKLKKIFFIKNNTYFCSKISKRNAYEERLVY